MQWSPRNRTDNDDDDDKSTSDDDADTGNGNAKNDNNVTAGNGTGTHMTIGSKDSDDDVVVDNVGELFSCFCQCWIKVRLENGFENTLVFSFKKAFKISKVISYFSHA